MVVVCVCRGGRVLAKGCQFLFPYIKILNVAGTSNKMTFCALGSFFDNLGNLDLTIF